MKKLAGVVGGSVRRETLNGRSYLVAPMTLLVPGVLNGSDGPIYYPPEEVSLDPHAWNGMPLVGYHPTKEGLPTSARSPGILETRGLGYTFNASYDGKLRGEAWFDEELTLRFDRSLADGVRIMPRLLAGKPIEMSTGLFLRQEPAPAGAVHNGVEYQSTARGFKPDHVAVLPDEQGACSVRDGCGIHVNQRPTETNPMALTPEQKQAHVTYLITNCAWWKKPGDAVILNNLPDDKLTELRQSAEATTPAPVPVPVPPSTIQLSPEQIDQLAVKLKEKLGLTPPAPVPAPVPTPAPVAATPATVPAPTLVAPVPVAAPPTMNQWLESAPAEIRSVVQNAILLEKAEKEQLVLRLTANVSDPAAKQAAGQMLMPKGLEELRALARLLPTANGTGSPSTPAGLFLAMSAPQTTGMPGYDAVNGVQDDMLVPPTINWKEPIKRGTTPAPNPATPAVA